MKIKYIFSSISLLACSLGFNCLNINSANAATLNFSYTFESDETLSGSFEGDLVPGTTEYTNLSNLDATYSGAPNVVFDTIEGGSSFNSEVSQFFSLVGSEGSTSGNVFTIIGGNNSDAQVIIATNGIIDADNVIVSSRFTVDVDNGGVVTTPEPGITLALATLGGLGCLHKIRKKRVKA